MRRLALLLVLVSAPTLATDYYVRTDGNDSTCDGLSNEAAGDGTCAWKTLGKCATTLAAGSRCLIQAGTYLQTGEISAPANSGAEVGGSPFAYSCTFTRGSTAVTCSSVAALAAGMWVRANDSEPYFAWTRVAAINGTTLTLDEGYRGPSASGVAIRAANFIEYVGQGNVVISRLEAKPAGVTWTQSGTYSNVYYYPKSTGTGKWAAPGGFSAQNLTWDKWFANGSGQDTLIKLYVTGTNAERCPCGVTTATTCEQHVAKVAGSWCDDGSNIWMRTWTGASPATVDVRASDAALGGQTWNVAGRNFVAVRNLLFRVHPNKNAGGANATDTHSGIVCGGNSQLVSGVTVEGAACRFDFSGGKTGQQFEHMHCLDKTTMADADVAVSGTRFYDIEFRGGYSNGVSFGFLRGTSSTDRVILDRIYLHRVFSWYRSTECAGDPVYDCAAGDFIVSGAYAQAGAHGAYIGTSATDRGINHILVQNSIIEVTGDGFCIFNGTGSDVVYRNNTFGASHSFRANTREETIEIGVTGSNGNISSHNNLFYVDDTTGGQYYDGAYWSHSNDWSGYVGDHNLYLHPWNNVGAHDIFTSTQTFKGIGALPDYSVSSIRSSLSQEVSSVVVCYSGCTAGSNVYNDGAASRSSFVKGYVSDGTASDYTPTATSRARDAGLNSQCPAEDFFGNPRSDGACDIGAVEYDSGVTPPSSGVVLHGVRLKGVAAGGAQ